MRDRTTGAAVPIQGNILGGGCCKGEAKFVTHGKFKGCELHRSQHKEVSHILYIFWPNVKGYLILNLRTLSIQREK